MRTTVDIDDDVLAAAKDLARAEGRTMGQVISELARRALTQPSGIGGGLAEAQVAYTVDEFPAFPLHGGGQLPVTGDVVRRLQEAADAEDAQAWDHGLDQPRAVKPFGQPTKNKRG